MARGRGKDSGKLVSSAMPRFVDVKLSREQKAEFMRQEYGDAELVRFLQSAADAGYRVGVSWSNETQAYTVSMTCRMEGDCNNGLCMTSFAKDVRKAVALAAYKHTVVTDGNWRGEVGIESEEFG